MNSLHHVSQNRPSRFLALMLLCLAWTNLINSSAAHAAPRLSPANAKRVIGARALQVLSALDKRDGAALAKFVHPRNGVRFSPYTFVNTKTDLNFSRAALLSLFSRDKTRVWGRYVGTGNPIRLTTRAYFENFVEAKQFQKTPHVFFNQFHQRGNTINNVFTQYSGAIIVEYYRPSSSPNLFDWQSLKLVFQKHGSAWYLRGVVHDQWTI